MSTPKNAKRPSTALPVIRAADITAPKHTTTWLIESLWAACAVGIIGGHPKSCKTWLGLDMAVSVASGTPALDRFNTPCKGPALVYLAEDNLQVVKERLCNLCAYRDLALKSLDLYVITADVLRIDNHKDFDTLCAIVQKIQPRLLVLDPFVRLHRLDENNAQDVASLLDQLRILQRQHNLAIAIVHHARKNGRPGQYGQALRGSSDLWAWGDSNLYLTRQKDAIRLDGEHRAAAPLNGLLLNLCTDPMHLEVSEVHDEAAPSLHDCVLTALSTDTPMTRTALRERLAINNKKLGDALISLDKQQKITRTKNGWLLR